jgi:hypothetical protein
VDRGDADLHHVSATNKVVMVMRQVVAGFRAGRLDHHSCPGENQRRTDRTEYNGSRRGRRRHRLLRKLLISLRRRSELLDRLETAIAALEYFLLGRTSRPSTAGTGRRRSGLIARRATRARRKAYLSRVARTGGRRLETMAQSHSPGGNSPYVIC